MVFKEYEYTLGGKMGNHKNGANRTVGVILSIKDWYEADSYIRCYISRLQEKDYNANDNKFLNHLANIRLRINKAVEKNKQEIKMTIKMYHNLLACVDITGGGKTKIYRKLYQQKERQDFLKELESKWLCQNCLTKNNPKNEVCRKCGKEAN